MEYILKKEDRPVNCMEKIKLFLTAHWSGVICLLVPIIFLFVILPPTHLPDSGGDGTDFKIAFTWKMQPIEKHCWVGYCLIIMAAYWVSECIPLPVTSFLPVVVFPLTGVMDTVTTCQCYFNGTIFMFLASLMLATCIEQSGLHIRLALAFIRLLGYSHYKLLLAMCTVTMFVSMWITNTAATTMMVPIIFAILRVFEKEGLLRIYDTNSEGDQIASDITTCYFCAATYSATIGGIGTLVGTATNLVFKGLFQEAYPKAPEYLSFPKFSAFTIPPMILMEAFMYLFLIFYYFGFLRPNSKTAKSTKLTPAAMEAARKTVMADTKKIGTITFWEIVRKKSNTYMLYFLTDIEKFLKVAPDSQYVAIKMVIILFSGAILGFFCRSPGIFPGWQDKIMQYYGESRPKYMNDCICGILVCFLMMLLPATTRIFKNCTAKYKEQLPQGRVDSVLDWTRCHAGTPWSFAFLLGGGFALSTAAGANYSNLNGQLGEFLKSALGPLHPNVILLLVITFTIFVTNFASNVATSNVVTPIAMTMATELKLNPLTYALATGLGASFCYMLPVGTPGNLVVQVAAKIPTKKMLIAGSVPTLTTIIILFLAVLLYGPVIWPDFNEALAWMVQEPKT